MSITRAGEHYLHTEEVCVLLNITFPTFKTLNESTFHLESRRFFGQGPRVFYRQTEVERVYRTYFTSESGGDTPKGDSDSC